MNCFSEETLDSLAFRGGASGDNVKFLNFAVDQCKNSTNFTDCRPQEEIERFMDGIYLIFLIRT